MTEVDKLLHSLDLLKKNKHTAFKTVYGEYNIDIDKLIEELHENKLWPNSVR